MLSVILKRGAQLTWGKVGRVALGGVLALGLLGGGIIPRVLRCMTGCSIHGDRVALLIIGGHVAPLAMRGVRGNQLTEGVKYRRGRLQGRGGIVWKGGAERVARGGVGRKGVVGVESSPQ